MKFTNNTNNVLNLFADAVNGDPEIAPLVNLPCLDNTGFNAEFDSVRRDSTNELISRDDLQTIWRGDNGAYLGHAKGRYHIVQNASLFHALNEAAKNTLNAREIESAILTEKTSDGGAFSSVQYRIPAMRETIGYANGNSTEIDFTIGFINSFDGSTSVKMRFGCYDLVCLNGLVLGEFEQATGRHTAGINIAKLGKFIADGITGYKDNIRAIKNMAASPLTMDQAHTWLLDNVGHKTNDNGEKILTRLGESLFVQFKHEAQSNEFNRGFNVFALHSALTYYASHNDSDSGFTVRASGQTDNEAKSLDKRGERVRRLISRESFTDLVIAA